MAKIPFTIELEDSIIRLLQERAEKEMMSIEELIEDILRRSAVSGQQKTSAIEGGDKFLSYFSRRKKSVS